MRAAGLEKEGFAQAVASAIGFERALTKVGVAALGLSAAKNVVTTFVGAFADAKKSSEDMARQVLDTASALRDIAAIKEKFGPDDAELKQHLAVRLASGLTHPEAHDYQEELYNSLGTVSKEKFDDQERSKLEILGAQYAARAGGGIGSVKARATLLGLLPDYIKGKPSAERVVDEADRIDVILGKGAGSQQVSTTQYQEILTALTSGDLKGFLNDPKQAAALNAIASKFGPNHSATSVMEAVREVRGLTKFRQGEGIDAAQAETLTAAGIDEKDDPVTAMRKLFKFMAPIVDKGEAFPVALGRRGFRNQTGNERLAQFFEQWRKGNFDMIMSMAEAETPLGVAEQKNAAFRQTENFQDLQGRAQIDQAKIIEGKKATALLIAKQQAEAKLIGEGLEGPAGKLKADIATAATLGRMEGRDVLIEQRAVQDARRRAGLPARDPRLRALTRPFDLFLPGIGAGDAVLGGAEAAATPFQNNAEAVRQLKRIADSNEQLLKQGQQQNGKPGAAPRPGAPPVLPAAPVAGPLRP